MIEKHLSFLQELNEIAVRYKEIGPAGAVINFCDAEFTGTEGGQRKYFSMKDDAVLETHRDDPYLFREIRLKKMEERHISLVTVLDFRNAKYFVCSSYNPNEISPITPKVIERYETWYGLSFDGVNPPVFVF